MTTPRERLDRYRDIGLLVLRLGFGLGFLYFHGWSKMVEGPERWLGVGDAMEHVGIPFGYTFFGFLASFAESVGGILIAIGFIFRPAAVLLAGTMFVAWAMELQTGGGAHTFKNLWVAIGLALMGPGRYSVDAWISARRRGAPTIELGGDRLE